MAVNDKPCFDVLFKSVVLLPCSYSLESFKHTVTKKLLCVYLNAETKDHQHDF